MTTPDREARGGGETQSATAPSTQTQVLVGRVRNGDPRAMEQLYRRLYPKMRACALLAMGGDARHAADVEDAVQQAFFDAFRVLVEGSGFADDASPGAFRRYLARIVTNLIRGEARRRARHHGGERSCDTSSGSAIASVEDGPATAAGDKEMFVQVEAALASLGERDRRVITLRYLCDMGSAEICAEMALPGGELRAGFRDVAQVRWTLYRAMERLRRALGSREAWIDRYFQTLHRDG